MGARLPALIFADELAARHLFGILFLRADFGKFEMMIGAGASPRSPGIFS